MSHTEPSDPPDVQAVHEAQELFRRIREQLSRTIVGQHEVIEQILIALMARGHALLEGVPGLAKTLMISSVAEALQLSFKRIQFTPDLMPSDVTGTDVIQEDTESGRRYYKFLPGPIFANLILADEINRTPPKTQAAMLEAMQERQVSAGGNRYELPEPFFVLATQNPLEQEGTYPLPEAQLDRFLLHIHVDYPTGSEEWDIARRITGGERRQVEECLSAEQLLHLQRLVGRIPVSDQVLGYAWALVRASRPGAAEAAPFVNQWLNWGSGPRGLLALIVAAQARAMLHGRFHATSADIQAIAKPALRHRISANFAAQANKISHDQLIEMLIAAVPADKKYMPPP